MQIKSETIVAYIVSCSMLLTALLFFVDEGLYSFAWMLEPGGWLVFLIYTIILSTLFGIVALGFRFFLMRSAKKES
ncbi:MAG: hypothetical protein WC760_02300 [Bacteroidia bacterium]|jgi:hypothetical protein